MPSKSHPELFQSSRGRIVNALRRGAATADELAATLGQTKQAIRAQLRSMERDLLVENAGLRPGTTRPFSTYRLTPAVEQLLSRAYVPLLTQLVQVFASRQSTQEFETVMRESGRALAIELRCRHDARQSLPARLAAASQLLNEQLGALTRVAEDSDGVSIRGDGCPLSALTGKNRGPCLAVEELLKECLGVPVKECCDREDRPRCCFRVATNE
jgi:DeoR family transcriptional regulator, suf operon transcriptional repressor